MTDFFILATAVLVAVVIVRLLTVTWGDASRHDR
jgi:hypothetical protein